MATASYRRDEQVSRRISKLKSDRYLFHSLYRFRVEPQLYIEVVLHYSFTSTYLCFESLYSEYDLLY